MNIRLPKITEKDPEKAIKQVEDYFFQLVNDLNYQFSQIETRLSNLEAKGK